MFFFCGWGEPYILERVGLMFYFNLYLFIFFIYLFIYIHSFFVGGFLRLSAGHPPLILRRMVPMFFFVFLENHTFFYFLCL